MSVGTDPLELFHPAVSAWFRREMGTPTAPQEQGWPLIAGGSNTLILAPTGSGKTLAAFLAGIDWLVRQGLQGSYPKGVLLLYISPLKALNYDIERNLRHPLEGISEELRSQGIEPPEIHVGVRTGDTPTRERARMARKPPQILITTPESLNLILSSRAAAILGNVRQVIIDEVHSLAPNKRGAFLSVLLERLENVCKTSPTRIGLSATQRPLEEVARFLVGYDDSGKQRPVDIVDAGVRKQLELSVTTAVPDIARLKSGELWPSIEENIHHDIAAHRSTIVFANNRRTVERLTQALNERADGVRLVEPHHGSISAPRRKETEERLKTGDLKGVIATSSLELGIDMGTVDLVCQIQSPKTVAAGLQRVGRAGHLYGATSRGKVYSTSLPDLLEAAVISKRMRDGLVEAIHAVQNPLDVLAQQIAAMTVHGPVKADIILHTVRRSGCFHTLPDDAFWRTAEMVAGRLGRDFPARVSLDRVRGIFSPLPGTLRNVVSGGVIPDTGQFPVYLSNTRLSVGELDEEFVWEAREGEAFRLGTSLWRIEKIDANRIFVHPTYGVPAKVPFWRGENVWRDADLGEDIGRFLHQAEQFDNEGDLAGFVRQQTACDPDAAANLARFILRQKQGGALPTAHRVVVEHFTDALGEGRMAVITPFGARVHQALRIALVELMRDETGTAPESMANDDGVLIRLPADSGVPSGLFLELTPERFRTLLDRGLMQSPLFGMRFRQNAARALLLPGAQPGKRNPLWLQRLKAKDLLQMARSVPGFPIVAETARECRMDYLDTERTVALLERVHSGKVEVSEHDAPSPSPFASSMEFLFNMEFMYVWDRPIGEAVAAPDGEDARLASLLESGERALDERALQRLWEEAQHTASRTGARTVPELAEVLRELGDLSLEEIVRRSEAGSTGLFDELKETRQAAPVEIAGELRWVPEEEADDWRLALQHPDPANPWWRHRAETFLRTRPGCTPGDFAARYCLPGAIADELFEAMRQDGHAHVWSGRWIPAHLLESARRITLAIRRQETRPVELDTFQQFLFRWQNLSPDSRLHGPEGLAGVVEQLAAAPAPAAVWEADILSRRLESYSPDWLDSLLASGAAFWRAVPGTGKPGQLQLLPRGLAEALPLPVCDPPQRLSDLAEQTLHVLRERGASFLMELALALQNDSRQVEEALRELAWAGLATHDSFAPVRQRGRSQPSLREAARSTHGTPRQRYHQLRKLRPAAPLQNPGRWWALPSPAEADEMATEMAARLLLERYGVLTRDVASGSGMTVSWFSLYRVLERLEMSGEIERGYYVDGLGGAQFALLEAARALRNWRSRSSALQLLSSWDPAIIVEGPWIRRPGTYIIFHGGAPALVVESASRRLTVAGSDADALEALDALPSMFNQPWPLRPVRRLEVEFWNDQPVAGHAVEEELRSRGFERTPRGLVYAHVERQ